MKTNNIFRPLIWTLAIFSFAAPLAGNAIPPSGLIAANAPAHVKAAVLDARVKGYGGVLPYFQDKVGKTYILISREAFGHDKGTYADFGGKVEMNKKLHAPHRLVTVARTELAEETMGLIHLSEQKLKKDSVIYYDLHKAGAGHIMTYTPVNYRPSRDFVHKRQKLNHHNAPFHSLEKDDFIWVAVSSLCKVLSSNSSNHLGVVTVEILDGSLKYADQIDTAKHPHALRKVKIMLRPFFAKNLRKLKPILQSQSATCRKVWP